jgi:hypothetical protein
VGKIKQGHRLGTILIKDLPHSAHVEYEGTSRNSPACMPGGVRLHCWFQSTSPSEQCCLAGQQGMMRGDMLVWRKWRRSQVVSLLVKVSGVVRTQAASKNPILGDDQSTCGAFCPIWRRGMKILTRRSRTAAIFSSPTHFSYLATRHPLPDTPLPCHRQPSDLYSSAADLTFCIPVKLDKTQFIS